MLNSTHVWARDILETAELSLDRFEGQRLSGLPRLTCKETDDDVMILSIFCIVLGLIAFFAGAFTKRSLVLEQRNTNPLKSPEDQTMQNDARSTFGLQSVAKFIPEIAATALVGSGLFMVLGGLIGLFFSLL
ncbi:MAG: hypothetical protein AAF641_05190 [Pseudomonadota bacterium]